MNSILSQFCRGLTIMVLSRLPMKYAMRIAAARCATARAWRAG
ncbi:MULTISPECIES: hypothetical protein [unclassified Burkholderia]|nr:MULTISPECIES: hypothetical protein [unclassified Burkholderia]